MASASSLVPSYEVKILLNNSTTASDNQLKGDVLSEFFKQPETKKLNVQFLDTLEQSIHANHWNLRIRRMEGKSEFDLTYKKRYQFCVGPLNKAAGNVAAALKKAEQDGFDSRYEAQIEVGYKSQTLSISYNEDVSSNGFQEMGLPSADDSRRLLADSAPKEFSTWGTAYLDNSVIYGPVFATRSKGKWNGLRLSIEVWPIRKSREDPTFEPIVEASFKESSIEKALEGKDKLVGFLKQKDWFLPEESSKTELVMERYRC